METLIPVGESSSNPAGERGLPVFRQERSPAYVWSKQSTIWLKYPQKLAVEYFLKTRNYAEVVKALREEGFFVSVATVSHWLHREDVREYVKEQIEERGIASGWTKERWLKIMTDHLQGSSRLAPGDLYAMKLIAGVCGFEEPAQMNVQNIQFVQSNGRP